MADVHRSRRDQRQPMIARQGQQRIEPLGRPASSASERCRSRADRPAPAGRRAARDTRATRSPARGRSQRRDPQPRAEHVVQMLLLDVVVLALAGDLHAERVAIEAQRGVRVVDHDRRVIDAEKQRVGRRRASGAALARRERDDFEKMAIGIAEVERADAAGVRVPVGQPLRSGGRVLDAVLLSAWRTPSSMSLTTIAMCWNRRSLARTSGGIGRPFGARNSVSSISSEPSRSATTRLRAPNTPVSSSYGRPENSWSDTFANGSTPV